MSKTCWILLALLICGAYAAPAGEVADDGDVVPEEEEEVVVGQQQPKSVTRKTPIVNILESETEHKDDGSYSFFYRSEDGTFRRESAVVVNEGQKDQHLQISGQYSYLDADGKEVIVNYMADNKGFVPEGSIIQPEIVTAVRQTSELGPYEPEPTNRQDRQDRQLNVNADNVPPLSLEVDEAPPSTEDSAVVNDASK